MSTGKEEENKDNKIKRKKRKKEKNLKVKRCDPNEGNRIKPVDSSGRGLGKQSIDRLFALWDIFLLLQVEQVVLPRAKGFENKDVAGLVHPKPGFERGLNQAASGQPRFCQTVHQVHEL